MRKRITTDEFIKRSNLIHNNKYNYSKSIYINSQTKIEIICKIHGSFFQTPSGHLNEYGCQKCAIINRNQNKPKSILKFIEDAKKIHGELYDYSKSNYIDSHTKIKIICKKHGIFKQKPNGHLSGKGCKKCQHIISNPEFNFLNYLKIPDVDENRQKRIENFKVDGIKNNKIFEFLGDYYHGNPKKYNSKKYNQICHKTFGQLYQKTIEKFNKLNRLGYHIYYIWENDWYNWNKNILSTFPIKKYKVNTLI